jgi:hypothetical protein
VAGRYQFWQQLGVIGALLIRDGETNVRQDGHVDRLLRLVADSGVLCLDVSNPGWDNARGYLFDSGTRTMFFPVAKKFLVGRNLERYEVLVWSQPRIIAIGRLSAATSDEDSRTQTGLARLTDLNPAQIKLMLFDGRNNKPRKNRYKLALETLREATV